MKKNTLIIFIVSIVCVGCVSLNTSLKSVVLEDGVSLSEAKIISDCYFTKHFAGGEIKSIKDGGDHWIILGNLGGYLAKSVSIEIDKTSGKIISKAGPNYDCPLNMSL